MAVERDITWNIRHFQGALRCDRNFDVVYRVFRICGREACMFFVDGFAKDEIMEKLLEFFYGIQDEDLLRDAHTFSKSCVPYCEVAISGEEDTIVGQILSGVWAVFVDGMDQCVLIDQRTYPQRTTSEPDQDKSFRGSRDGFVETMVFNAALIRRRIRSPGCAWSTWRWGRPPGPTWRCVILRAGRTRSWSTRCGSASPRPGWTL